MRPNPRLAGGGGCSSSPSDLEPGSALSSTGGGGGGARFAVLSVSTVGSGAVSCLSCNAICSWYCYVSSITLMY